LLVLIGFFNSVLHSLQLACELSDILSKLVKKWHFLHTTNCIIVFLNDIASLALYNVSGKFESLLNTKALININKAVTAIHGKIKAC